MKITPVIKCQFKIGPNSECEQHSKIKLSRPNPVDPGRYPKYFCYSHVSSYVKQFRGQFIIETILRGE